MNNQTPIETKFKGVPGPWKVGRHTSEIIAENFPNDIPISDSGHAEVEYYGGYLIAESVERRNTSLIAAAPELLKSAIEVIESIQGNSDLNQSDSFRKLKEAVTKALKEP